MIGGGGPDSGKIEADSIGSVKIGRDLRGGTNSSTGSIVVNDSIGTVTIGGSLIGHTGLASGIVRADGPIKSVKITGDVRGVGDSSGSIGSGSSLGTVKVGGSLIGGPGTLNAIIRVDSGTIKSVTIGGDVRGDGISTAAIGAPIPQVMAQPESPGPERGGAASVSIGSVTIRGSLVGDGINSATVFAHDIGRLSIGGDVRGGAGSGSGQILATGELKTATIGRSLVGGGGAGSGYFSTQKLGTLKIGHDLRGGTDTAAGSVFANLGGARSITIGGSVFSGTAANTGAVDVNGALGSLTIMGSVHGTAATPVTVRARGVDSEIAPLALGKLTIKGSATFLQVLGGYGAQSNVALNADANLGTINVSGDWIASSIVAGVNPGPNPGANSGGDGLFGTTDDTISTFGNDAANVSKIASITIKGQLLGTAGGGDAFGFVAQQIGKLKVGKVSYKLTSDVDIIALGATGDFNAREDV